MAPEFFIQIQQAYVAGGAEAAFDRLVETLRAEKNYDALFDALMLRHRHALGLPLLAHQKLSDLDPTRRRKYEEAYIDVCREIGRLYLQDGNIPAAYRYFRAIGEIDPVREALAHVDETENVEELINLAFGEGVDPRRGFEWTLKHFGACRAITCYDQYPPGAEGKQDCAARLLREIYQELSHNLKHWIEQREGTAPDTDRVAQLLQGRDWLYEDNYLVDISHLAAVTRFSIELVDPEALRMAAELADYGRRLPDTGFYAAGMPVQDHLNDCSLYLHALLGENAEEAVAYFRKKIADAGPDAGGPAQLLVYLFVRLGRLDEAREYALEHLADVPAEELRLSPSIAQLCHMSNRLDRLLDYARARQDVLTFVSGLVLQGPSN